MLAQDGDESPPLPLPLPLPLPVSAAREAGARFVIAIEVVPRAGSAPADASTARRERDRQRSARIDPEAARADWLTQPPLGYEAGPWRSYFAPSRALSEASARAALPALATRLASVD